MTENEEFEFRLRLEREQAVRGSAPNTAEGVNAAFGKPAKEPKSYASRLGSAALRGSMFGGPIPAMVNAGMEASDVGSELLQKAGYEGGGLVTDITGSPEAGVIANAGIQAIPSVLSVPARTPSLLEKPARWLMRHSMTPDRAARIGGEAERAVGTMLERDINPTRGGLEKARDLRDKLESVVDDVLSTSKAKVNPENVALQNLKMSVAKIADNEDPVKDLAIIDKAINTFLKHPKVAELGEITVKTANDLKKGIYAQIKAARANAYGPQRGQTPTKIMTDKDRASSLRQAVAEAEPKVVPTLADQAEVMNVISVLKPQVSREAHGRLASIAALSPRLENAIVFMLDRYPWFKSYLARSGYTLGKHPATTGLAAGQAIQDQP